MATTKEINTLILRIKQSEYVTDVKVEKVSSQDFDYKVLIDDVKNKARVLIRLENMIYFNRLFSIKAIKGIEDGISILDIKGNTYKIIVEEESKISDNDTE